LTNFKIGHRKIQKWIPPKSTTRCGNVELAFGGLAHDASGLGCFRWFRASPFFFKLAYSFHQRRCVRHEHARRDSGDGDDDFRFSRTRLG
jgi:hypothetical protein